MACGGGAVCLAAAPVGVKRNCPGCLCRNRRKLPSLLHQLRQAGPNAGAARRSATRKQAYFARRRAMSPERPAPSL